MILNIISSFIDMILIIIFFNEILAKRKKHISLPVFLGGFICMEILLFLISQYFWGIQSLTRMVVTVLASLLSTYLLTFYYDAMMRHRIFVTVSFQFFTGLAEFMVYEITVILETSTSVPVADNDAYWYTCSLLILFLLIMLTKVILKNKHNEYSAKYNLMILLMPVVSCIILSTIPLQTNATGHQTTLSIIGMFGLLFVNLANYFLLDNLIQNQMLKEKQIQLNQQLAFQENKYQLISAAYRNTRSLIHDTKKHFFFIQECVNNEQYDNIHAYLSTAIDRLESTYVRINTGNLVIDSFVSNHMEMAARENIGFETDIQVVKEHIPTVDYDLCVILGNLLDNSMQACRKIVPPYQRKIHVALCTTSLDFIIHIFNTCAEHDPSDGKKETNLFHGYGLSNVETIVLKYSGVFSHYVENGQFHVIVTIPTTIA